MYRDMRTIMKKVKLIEERTESWPYLMGQVGCVYWGDRNDYYSMKEDQNAIMWRKMGKGETKWS
jgi:hypothetical protein